MRNPAGRDCRKLSKNEEKEDKHAKYLKRERFTGMCSRSYYVGDNLKEEDIYNNSEFTGYHKVVSIKDDILVENSGTKTADTTKQITVEVFYKLENNEESIKISTYISKE